MAARPESDAGHTPWSDPGAQAAFLRTLPADPAALPDVLERFVIHHAIARRIGHSPTAEAEADRDLRRVERLLAVAAERDDRPLTEKRPIERYLYGTCHDFALLAVAALRERGVPARLRAGFASYFNEGRWEDHWICEHWTGGRWAVMDAQLGPIARDGFRIGFDVADLPDAAWRSAAAIWRAIRAGLVDAPRCGLSPIGLTGEWFVAAALLRDAAALAGIETLPWDFWGPSREVCAARAITEAQRPLFDALADAFDPAPADRDAALAALAAHPWAKPERSILTFPEGRPSRELVLAEA